MQPQGSTPEVGTQGGREVGWEMDFELKATGFAVGREQGRKGGGNHEAVGLSPCASEATSGAETRPLCFGDEGQGCGALPS